MIKKKPSPKQQLHAFRILTRSLTDQVNGLLGNKQYWENEANKANNRLRDLQNEVSKQTLVNKQLMHKINKQEDAIQHLCQALHAVSYIGE